MCKKLIYIKAYTELIGMARQIYLLLVAFLNIQCESITIVDRIKNHFELGTVPSYDIDTVLINRCIKRVNAITDLYSDIYCLEEWINRYHKLYASYGEVYNDSRYFNTSFSFVNKREASLYPDIETGRLYIDILKERCRMNVMEFAEQVKTFCKQITSFNIWSLRTVHINMSNYEC